MRKKLFKTTNKYAAYTAGKALVFFSNSVIFLGNITTAVGCIALLLGVLGIFDMDLFALGLSSGVRIIGSLAISGCLLSAIGYGILDYSKN